MSERQEYCQAHIQYLTHKTKYGKSSTTKLNMKDWILLNTKKNVHKTDKSMHKKLFYPL